MTDIETFREQQLTRLRDAGALAAFEGAPPELLAALKRVVGASDFVREALEREAGLGKWLIEEAELGLALDATAMARRIEAAAASAKSARELHDTIARKYSALELDGILELGAAAQFAKRD